MKKYLAISLLIHSAVFLRFSINNNDLDSSEKQEQEQKKGRNYGDSTFDIIPIYPGNKGIKKKPNACYYYGIGIKVDQIFTAMNGEVLLSYRIKEVITGYSAESSGLQAGDIVVKIDEKRIDPLNDIIGVKEGQIILTVMRGSSMLTLKLKRMKVYCD